MSNDRVLPVEGFYVYHSNNNDSIYLGSTVDELADLRIPIPHGTIEYDFLQKKMLEHGIFDVNIEKSVEKFLEMGSAFASYDSGISFFRLDPLDKVPDYHIKLYDNQHAINRVVVTLNAQVTGNIALIGLTKTGKSIFCEKAFDERATIVDFKKINFDMVSDYDSMGHKIVDDFLKEKNKQFMVLHKYRDYANIDSSYPYHPTLYKKAHDIIVSRIPELNKKNKVVIESMYQSKVGYYNSFIKFFRKSDDSINEESFGYTFGGFEFPTPDSL